MGLSHPIQSTLFAPHDSPPQATLGSRQALLPLCATLLTMQNAALCNWALSKAELQRTKDHFHPEGHITDFILLFQGHLIIFSPLRAGSKLQAHVLGHLSCSQRSLLMAAKSYCTLALAFDLPRHSRITSH